MPILKRTHMLYFWESLVRDTTTFSIIFTNNWIYLSKVFIALNAGNAEENTCYQRIKHNDLTTCIDFR